MSKNENLSSTQKKVKKPRPIRYDGPKKNADPAVARDIITLYVTCQLGYSAIRHIIADKNDHLVEDVVRQHMLGRKDVDGEIGELYCPGSTQIEECNKEILKKIIKKYGSQNDPYVVEMMTKGSWKDDPVVSKNTCKACGKKLEDSWRVCPFCGKKREIKNRELLGLDK